MFGGSAIFVYIFFSLDKDRYSVFGVVMQYLGFILFLFSLIFSIALLLRRKPMLTVTDQQIIIYHMLVKKSLISFEDIASFYISDNRHRGIKIAEHILIVLKSPEKTKKNAKIAPYFSQSIQADILNVKAKVLLELLNTRLETFNDLKKRGLDEIV